jgi:lysyl-tRNA synthetase class 2
MDEVKGLVQQVFHLNSIMRLSYRGVFEFYVKLNVLTCSDQQIEQCALGLITGLPIDLELDRDGWLELLMSHIIEPRLAAMNLAVFIYDFPASQAQLAKIKKDETGNDVADRFELYINGVEIANGYNELLDADELQRRFTEDNKLRQDRAMVEMPIDNNLLAAMKSGMPVCSGVALGFDRIVMLALNKQDIQAVQSFTFSHS